MNDTSNWYAVRTRHDFRAEAALKQECDEVFFPKEVVKTASGRLLTKAVIPRILFIRTSFQKAMALEQRGRDITDKMTPFWIYRYEKTGKIQTIPERQIQLIKLLTTNDTTGCEVLINSNLRKGQYVRVTGGLYKGYEGYVQRIKKNKHVVVRIEGICLVVLPFIHPDLLEIISSPDA